MPAVANRYQRLRSRPDLPKVVNESYSIGGHRTIRSSGQIIERSGNACVCITIVSPGTGSYRGCPGQSTRHGRAAQRIGSIARASACPPRQPPTTLTNFLISATNRPGRAGCGDPAAPSTQPQQPRFIRPRAVSNRKLTKDNAKK